MQKLKSKNQKYSKGVRMIASGAMLIGLFFALPHSVSAARLFLVHQGSDFGTGDVITISVMLDPQGTEVNAVQATIGFDNSVSLLAMRDADSIIGQWIARDAIVDANAHQIISMSGIMPGGYRGNLSAYWEGERPGKMIDLIFRAERAGDTSFEIKDASVLLNDGKGTVVPLQTVGDSATIKPTLVPGGGSQNKPYAPVDVMPPDAFMPIVGSDPLLFDGNYFVSFVTRDNDTGIASYEVAESRRKADASGYKSLLWQTAVSPYRLADQSLESYVYVKAIDGAGNERVAVVSPAHTPSISERLGGWGVAVTLALGFACLIGWYILIRKKEHVRH